MPHDCTNGKPCGYKDHHLGQHRSVEALKASRDYMRTYNAGPGVENAQRYRNRNPVKRALTVIKSNAGRRVGA